MKSRSVALFAGALLIISGSLVIEQRNLQAQSASGSIVGTISDASGAVVQGVTVRVTNLQESVTRTTLSGPAGEYSVNDLAPATYAVVALKPGMNFSQVFTHGLVTGELFRADFNSGATNVNSTSGIEQKLEAMEQRIEQRTERRIEQLEAEINTLRSSQGQPAVLPVRQPHGPLLAMNLPTPSLPPAPGIVAIAAPDAPSTPPAPPAGALPKALEAPDAGPPVDNVTPFAFADFTWLNGASRNKDTVLDTKFFTPEARFDTHYMEDFNQPIDHTIVGSTESFRSGEIQVEQASVGGDFHWDNVRGRILFMEGLYATTTPRTDASSTTASYPGNAGAVGQWDLQSAYRYVSEAYGGYHFNVQHGLNVDAGIFVSYVGLFSYYNFDNWAYQPSYVSSNTPWFFNGVRVQWFPTNKLKIEPWFINGWQSYARYNSHPGLGGQLLWMPEEWFKLVANQYGFGQDNPGLPHTERTHTDDSIEIRFYNDPESTGLSKIAMSLTADAGCQYGGGIQCTGAPSRNKESFIGWMAYNRYWFRKNLLGLTLGGGEMSNWGRYLTLLPPIDGALAASGTPYFTENPGQRAHMWDSTVTLQYMPKEYLTWWIETGYRHSDVPYFTGRGGVTPPKGNNGFPQYYTCMSGTSAGTSDLAAAQVACGGASQVWFPDLRRSEAKLSAGVLVRF
jgi:hypothetical protein